MITASAAQAIFSIYHKRLAVAGVIHPSRKIYRFRMIHLPASLQKTEDVTMSYDISSCFTAQGRRRNNCL